MKSPVSFRGKSGQAWTFTRVATDAPWARSAGVALFAAPDAYGWRLIRVVELTGKTNNLQPFWAFTEAERFGANTVFLAPEMDADARLAMIADIEEGLSPVFLSAAPDAIAA
jgi:hypothetical protein